MTEATDTTQEPNSQTTTDQSAPKGDAPAPGSSDTTSSTTETKVDDEGSLLNPKGDESQTDENNEKNVENKDEKGESESALFGAPADDAAYEIAGLPDGLTIDDAALAAVTPLARELNLSNEGLSKLAGVYAESVLPGVVAQVQQQVADQVNADVAALRKDWATQARAAVTGGKAEDGTDIAPDPAFGGKTLKEVQQIAAKAIDRFGGAEFREFVETNGLGNHPVMLKWAFLSGSAISEDMNFENGPMSPATPKTREQKYYNRS